MDIRKAFMSDITVGLATPKDWEPAMELVWKTFLRFEAGEYGREGTENFLNFISDEKLFKMFLSGNYKLMLAKSEGRIVGVIGVRTGNHVSLLFVDESYHRQGIGRLLLSNMQRLVEEDKKSVRLTVNAAPYAVDFYKKVGFIATKDLQRSDGISYLPMECLVRIDQ